LHNSFEKRTFAFFKVQGGKVGLFSGMATATAHNAPIKATMQPILFLMSSLCSVSFWLALTIYLPTLVVSICHSVYQFFWYHIQHVVDQTDGHRHAYNAGPLLRKTIYLTSQESTGNV